MRCCFLKVFLLFLFVLLPRFAATAELTEAGLTTGLTAQEDNEAALSEDYFDDWIFLEGQGLIAEADAPTNPAVPDRCALGARRNVVSKEQIQQQGSKDFSGTLRNVPGVIAGQRNLAGTTTGASLFVRGRGATHPATEIAVYFDGVPRHGFIYGQTMADGIPVNAAALVEVRKSPQPSEFGAGYALVNVQPRYMNENGWIAEGGFSGGSFFTFSQNAAFGLRTGRFDIFAAQSWFSTIGHVVHSGASQQSYYINAGLSINDNWTLRLLGNYVTAFTEQAPYTGQNPDHILSSYQTDSFFSTITLRNKFDNFKGFLRLYYTNTQFRWLDEDLILPGSWSLQSLQAFGARARQEFDILERGFLAAGMDLDWKLLVNEDHNPPPRSTVITTFPAMILFSPYIGASWQFGAENFRITPSAGVRGFFHNVWANQLSWHGGLAFGRGAVDLNFNYSRGLIFPAPAVIQNLLGDSAAFQAADLSSVQPETIDHFEIGITFSPQTNRRFSYTLDASYFYNVGRNRIIVTSQIPGNASAVSSFTLQGLELAASFSFFPHRLPADSIELFAGGTWYTGVTAVDENGNTANRMPFTPVLSLSAGFKWIFLETFSFSGDLQYMHEMYTGMMGLSPTITAPPAANRLGDILLLNLRFGVRFAREQWRLADSELFVAVNNLLNTQYEYFTGFVMPGITYMIGFSFRLR